LEAELALRTRSEFLANMSHELRTPLNAVIGFSQMMESGIFGKVENEHHAEYVKNINASGQDLLAKIEDLLEIADIDAGRIAISRSELYINDMVKYVLKMQAHHANMKEVSLSYVPRGNMLLFVDSLKMQHILGHLVANAIKFNKAGGEVTIEVGRAENCGIRISVHDTGAGMSDLKCHDIREALQQDSCWTTKDSHHIGVGLALTKEIIGLHGGAVDIESSAGIGTTISITLPRSCLRVSPSKKQLENNKSLFQLDTN
jgi:signal transduction histidine kinase